MIFKAIAIEDVKSRLKPEPTAISMFTYKKGDIVTVTEINGDYYKVLNEWVPMNSFNKLEISRASVGTYATPTSIKIEYEVNTKISNLNYRTGPGMTYKRIGSIPKGRKVIATKQQNGWYYIDSIKGWVSGQYLKKIKDMSTGSSNSGANTIPVKPPTNKDPVKVENDPYISGIGDKVATKNDDIPAMKYIMGMPYQYTHCTDPRPEKSFYGRVFLKTIVQDMPVVLITPGEPKFLTEANSSEKEKALKLITGKAREDGEAGGMTLDDVLAGKGGRYYGFENKMTEYFDYVNNMCRIASVYLGIDKMTPVGGKSTYKKFNWNNISGDMRGNGSFFDYMKKEPSIAFFVDAQSTNYGESAGNSTDTSMIESTMQSAGNLSKEFKFLFNKDIGEDVLTQNKNTWESTVDKILSSIKLDQIPLADQLKDYGTTVVNGANVIFPEIWKESSYSKDYTLDIKLSSPYGDTESIYLHILVPLFHIVALAYPRQLGRAGYLSPFILRCFCKGWFNCNMGMVTSVNIRKASQGGWNHMGLPTEVDVTINIKDLYSNMAIPRNADFSTFANIEYMDFLATMCGVNINAKEITRTLDMYMTWAGNKIFDIDNNISSKFTEFITNKIRGFSRI